jgi:hypothetical protein
MRVSRRGFLGCLAGAAAAIAVPELLVPKRTFFLPPDGGWINSLPFKQPDPALFEVLEEIDRASNDMTDAFRYSVGWTDPRGAFGSNRLITPAESRAIDRRFLDNLALASVKNVKPVCLPSRMHQADTGGRILEKIDGHWRYLVVPG